MAVVVLAMSLVWTSRAIASPDDICEQLRVLETSPLTVVDDGKAVRRWVEFNWQGDWMVGGSWGCRHSHDKVGAAVCAYLMNHTSREFRASLPLRVLSCYGHSFPKYAQYDWTDWTASVKLHGQKDDRQMIMDIDLAARRSSAATVRISVIPEDPSKLDKEPDPLPMAKFLSDK